ncbi:hypothetical protein [Bacillus thuringiensis]|uniref:hypothetical protein n=1 Tax=Bacillus thuringiensis TaxID=1428 RepID=UPI000BF5BF5A|nr:hypothetical protein [Bacillus thuringiensis]PES54405.1 hypothetical protein CN506_20230 [Bacillus thuringiensis]
MEIFTYERSAEGVLFEADRETFIVMARVPKIIVFENEEELHKFKSVLELMQDVAEDAEDDDGCYHLSLVDEFEQESHMMDDDEYNGRKLKVVTTDASDEYFNNNIEVRFGVLNSGDLYLDEEHMRDIVKYLNMFTTHERAKYSTARMIKRIVEVFEEDLKAIEHNEPYFKVSVEGD